MSTSQSIHNKFPIPGSLITDFRVQDIQAVRSALVTIDELLYIQNNKIVSGGSGGIGPMGPAGPQGNTGRAGPTGPQGVSGSSHWTDIEDKPNTIAGYGITDSLVYSGSLGAVNGVATLDVNRRLTLSQMPLLTKAMVELNNVDNTSDINKPVSNPQQTALDSVLQAAQDDATVKATAVQLASAPKTHVGAGGAAHAIVTPGSNGFMTATDKQKIDGIEQGAQVNVVLKVADRTGLIVLDKNDVGLNNVDNTSDANKPVSTATQAALNLKVNTADIVNTLVSTSSTVPLSAAQGKVLKDTLTTEITDRTTADTTNLTTAKAYTDTSIATEVTNRNSAIGVETTRATNAENTLLTAISNEISIRGTAITALNTRVDNVLSNVDATALNSLSEIVAGFQSADSNLVTSINTLSSNSTTALNTEITNRTTADTNIQTELDTVETAIGLSTSGVYITPTGTVYLNSATSVKDATIKLDTAIGNEVTNRGTAITNAISTASTDATTKANAAQAAAIAASAPIAHVGATGTAHGVVTTSVAGFMSAADKVKLDSVSSNAVGLQTVTITGDGNGSGTNTINLTLANSGVVAGTYNNTATAITPYTVDGKGRITGVGAAVTIKPDWTNIVNKPTTLATSGLTDVPSITGLGASGTWGINTTGSVKFTDAANVNASYVIPFGAGINSQTSLLADTELTYNPNTNTLSVKNLNSDNISLNGGSIAKLGGTAPAYYLSQDGTGRQHWYWNTTGGTVPTFAVAGEDASDVMHTVTVNGNGGCFMHRSASGVGKNAGDLISWTTTIYADLTSFSYLGQTVYHTGNIATANVATATKLAATKTINGVAFDGSANITINAVDSTARVASSLLGVANGVATLGATSLVPVAQLPIATVSAAGVVKIGSGLTIDGNGLLTAAGATNLGQGTNTATTVVVTSSTGTSATLNAVTSTLAGVMVAADKVKLDAITGTNTGDQTTITGNAGTATKLQTARTINGVAFDGSGNITVSDSSKLPLAGGTLTGSLTIGNVDNQLLLYRNAAQYLVLENNDVSQAPYIASYTDPANAKPVTFDSRTDGVGTAVTAGILGYNFLINGSNAFIIQTDKSIIAYNTLQATQFKSTIATGTSPFTVVSTTPVANLNIGGNAATVTTNANLTGVVTSVGNATSIAAGVITNAMLANAAVANLSGTNTGDETLTSIKTKLGVTTLSGSNTGDQTTITGNAGSATKLQTARNINGVAFDGTQDISFDVTDSSKQPLLTAGVNIKTIGGVSPLGGGDIPAFIDNSVLMDTSAIDLSQGAVFYKTITDAATFGVLNIAPAGRVSSFILELTNAGAYAISWFANIKWSGGTAPVLTSAGKDALGFYTRDHGATWVGVLINKDFK